MTRLAEQEEDVKTITRQAVERELLARGIILDLHRAGVAESGIAEGLNRLGSLGTGWTAEKVAEIIAKEKNDEQV